MSRFLYAPYTFPLLAITLLLPYPKSEAFEYSDSHYHLKLGGRAHINTEIFGGVINTAPSNQTGSDLYYRRLRLELGGHVYDWGFKVAINVNDESDPVHEFTVTYQGWSEHLRLSLGQQKEDFGLTDTGSSNWITPIERAIVSDAFDPGHNIGIKLHGHHERVTYSTGFFKVDNDQNNALNLAHTSRVVFRPIVEEQAIMHLGAAFSYRNSDAGFDGFTARLGVRGNEIGDATNLGGSAFTNNNNGNKQSLFNIEWAGQWRSLHTLTEFFSGRIFDTQNSSTQTTSTQTPSSPSLEADGFSIQAGYILTGEQRVYKKSTGVFDAVTPQSTSGAWEIFAAYSELNG